MKRRTDWQAVRLYSLMALIAVLAVYGLWLAVTGRVEFGGGSCLPNQLCPA